MGLEPSTSILRVRRATHCARPPIKSNKCFERIKRAIDNRIPRILGDCLCIRDSVLETLETVYQRQCIRDCVLQTVYQRQCIRDSVLEIVYQRQCIRDSVLETVYQRQCIRDSVLEIVYQRQCIIDCVLQTVYYRQCIRDSVLGSLYFLPVMFQSNVYLSYQYKLLRIIMSAYG